MSLTKQFKTNETKEVEGVPIKFGPNSDGTVPTFYITRQSNRNKKYVKVSESVMKPYRRQMATGTLDDKLARALMIEIFVKSILVGWANVKACDIGPNVISPNIDGDAPFTEEYATMLFEALPELFDTLNAQANNVAIFQDDDLEDDAKLIEVLAYRMEHGQSELALLNQLRNSNEEVPEFIQNAPILDEGLELYMIAFMDLTNDRQIGMGLGPIPFMAMLKYSEYFGLDEDQTDQLIFFVQKMDNWYVNFIRSKE